MKKTILVSTLLLLAASAPTRAQSPGATPAAAPAQPELPSGPLLKSVPDFSQWEVAFVYPEDQMKKDRGPGPAKPPFTGADKRPRKIMTTKTGKIVHEEITDLLNRSTEKWYSGSSQFTKLQNNPTWSQADAGLMGDQSYKPLPANGFRDMDWIRPENYAGIIPHGAGLQYLVFTPGGYQKLDLRNADEREKRLAAVDSVALIDADERLPVTVRSRSEIRTYHFLPPPTEMQVLPPDLSEQIKKGEEARARLFQPAPRPR